MSALQHRVGEAPTSFSLTRRAHRTAPPPVDFGAPAGVRLSRLSGEGGPAQACGLILEATPGGPSAGTGRWAQPGLVQPSSSQPRTSGPSEGL